MTELEEQEQYNKEFNERMASRPINNLIICPKKCNMGWFQSTIYYPEKWICNHCKGTGYVNVTT
jgi:hypothetical protein